VGEAVTAAGLRGMLADMTAAIMDAVPRAILADRGIVRKGAVSFGDALDAVIGDPLAAAAVEAAGQSRALAGLTGSQMPPLRPEGDQDFMVAAAIDAASIDAEWAAMNLEADD